MNAKIRMGMAAAMALAIAPAYADRAASTESACDRPQDVTSLDPATNGCAAASWVGGGYDVFQMEAVLSIDGRKGPAQERKGSEPDERLLQAWAGP